ncbi:hypothetical protein LSH36_153g04146 [Paralvinella palmiformis]|uniref:Uncharacterized protein n=1 Tax=Paralvinella palmiformis TaxID=53620 RepID=A0AAD9N7A1_9ANNE|nr:hypothetical protein LSH36_153g04146 [Paralvinella palmiformis]
MGTSDWVGPLDCQWGFQLSLKMLQVNSNRCLGCAINDDLGRPSARRGLAVEDIFQRLLPLEPGLAVANVLIAHIAKYLYSLSTMFSLEVCPNSIVTFHTGVNISQTRKFKAPASCYNIPDE